MERKTTETAIRIMYNGSGFSEKAIDYYALKPHMGILPNADQVSGMTGTCGDTMEIYLEVKDGLITDAKYDVMGCIGAVSAAMAVVDLIKGKPLDCAETIGDSEVFYMLEEIPEEKHHCIQLAVKTLHKALHEYKQNHSAMP
ncbi:MAG: iron-sulfur cluster assembly scaffold protein [Desulfobacterales bacterium]